MTSSTLPCRSAARPTPGFWSSLPGVQFGDFNSVLLIIIGVIANGSVALIALILVVILAWNYLKLLLEAAERYVVLGILVFTAPLAFYGRGAHTKQHFQKLVPNVQWAASAADYERMSAKNCSSIWSVSFSPIRCPYRRFLHEKTLFTLFTAINLALCTVRPLLL